MCLYATRERRAGHQPSRRRTAWKMVQIKHYPDGEYGRRAPPYKDNGRIDYAAGSTHRVGKKKIEQQRSGHHEGYGLGLHVFTSAVRAREVTEQWNVPKYPHTVVKVQVDPKDWIAENTHNGEAVYSKLKVLT